MVTGLEIEITSNEFDSLFAELCENIKGNPSLFKKILDLSFDVSNFPVKVCRINFDEGSAGAGKLIIRFEPTDFLRMFLVALRTGEIDSFILKHSESSL